MIENLSRTTDPASSRAGERYIRKSGALESQCRRIHEALTRHPNHTALELSAKTGLDYYVIQRRLSVLERRGMATRSEMRVCTVGTTGLPVQAWKAL